MHGSEPDQRGRPLRGSATTTGSRSRGATGPPDAEEVLYAAAPRLAELATQQMYAEQPVLTAMGDRGRAHTVEDFGHHFRALSSMDADRFTEYVRYCVGLFDARTFPQAWLTDAWRHMEAVIIAEMTPEIAVPAVAVLVSGVSAGSARPHSDGA